MVAPLYTSAPCQCAPVSASDQVASHQRLAAAGGGLCAADRRLSIQRVPALSGAVRAPAVVPAGGRAALPGPRAAAGDLGPLPAPLAGARPALGVRPRPGRRRRCTSPQLRPAAVLRAGDAGPAEDAVNRRRRRLCGGQRGPHRGPAAAQEGTRGDRLHAPGRSVNDGICVRVGGAGGGA